MLLTLDMLGASSFIWMMKHVYLHHFFTNTSYDNDIQLYPLIAIHPTDTTLPFHKYQARYAPILYAIFYFFWVIFLDFFKYFSGKI